MKITDIMDKYKQRDLGLLSDEQLEKQLSDELVIHTYISLSRKCAYLHNLNEKFASQIETYLKDDSDVELIYMLYEITVLFDVVFQYVNIEMTAEQKSVEVYDFCMNSGFYKYLTDRIGDDANKFVDMFEKTSGITNLNIFIMIRNAVNSNITGADIEELKSVIKGITPKKLGMMNEFMAYNNPAMNNMLDNIKKVAMEDTDKKMKAKKGRKNNVIEFGQQSVADGDKEKV